MKKLSTNDYIWGESLDSVLYTFMVKRLTMPTKSTPAYKMGIVNDRGVMIREPKTQEERRAFTSLDRIAFMMKQYMRGNVRLIYNQYRKRRLDPNFIRALGKGKALRFTKYYDMEMPFYDAKTNPNMGN